MTTGDLGTLYPIPPGTRDTLPTEMAELRSLLEPFRRALEAAGYGEIHTPALEYEDVLDVGDVASTEPSFRLFDASGRTLVLRSDMTIPVARVVATRLRDVPPPHRLYYISHVYRLVRERVHERREFLQAGAELIGVDGVAGTLELLHAMVSALDAAGLNDFSVVVGHADLLPRLLAAFEVPESDRGGLLHELVTRDYVGLRRKLDALQSQSLIDSDAVGTIHRAVGSRGDASILDHPDPRVHDALAPLRTLFDGADDSLRRVLIFDLGLMRQLGYYTGEIFEVHHRSLGTPLGGGGRYDNLLPRFGCELSAVGFGITVDYLHMAALAEARDAEA